MALFFECMQLCALKVLDTADIVRDAMLRQLSQFDADWGRPAIREVTFRIVGPTVPQ
jgi:hypothetical protein